MTKMGHFLTYDKKAKTPFFRLESLGFVQKISKFNGFQEQVRNDYSRSHSKQVQIVELNSAELTRPHLTHYFKRYLIFYIC